jgi:hypothetical protein
MRHKLFTSESQYSNWASRTKVASCWGGDSIDWQLRDELKASKPERYPCIAVYSFENDHDRMGEIQTRLLEFVYLGEFDGSFDPYAEQKAEEKRQKHEEPYWIALSEWGNYTKFKREGFDEKIAEV